MMILLSKLLLYMLLLFEVVVKLKSNFDFIISKTFSFPPPVMLGNEISWKFTNILK